MDRRLAWPGRLAGRLRAGRDRAAGLPRGIRLGLVGVALVAGFALVVLPLFSGGGPVLAEVSGQLPARVIVGQQVRADLAVDNTGLGSISPLCLAMSGAGAHLVSANFQGLDQVTASGNRVCGGQLGGQQTISVTIVFSVDTAGATTLRVVPQQGATAVGAAFAQALVVS